MKEQQDDQDLQIVDIDDMSSPNKKISILPQPFLRLIPQRRRVQIFVTVALVVLMLTGILSSNASIRDKLVQAVVPPSPLPTPALALGTDNFYASADVGWGHLFLDGKLVKHLPNVVNNDAPIHLAYGKHTLLWRADPFPSVTCTVSVPNNYQSDTCQYDQIVGGSHGSGWLFAFSSDLSELATAPRTRLLAEVQKAIQAYTTSDVVRVGESYRTDPSNSRRAIANEPLRATLRYQLDINTTARVTCTSLAYAGEGGGCLIGKQDCRTFCLASNFFIASSNATQTWDVFAATRSTWQYTTFANKALAPPHVDLYAGASPLEQLIPLQIAWDGTQWHVKSAFSLLSTDTLRGYTSTSCNNASFNESTASDVVEATNVATIWNFASAPNDATGCLGLVTLDQSPAARPATPPALCLYRFGVYLAVNGLARKYWPTMPVADAFEKHLAQQLYNASLHQT